MESNDLTEFYRDVRKWPETEAELTLAASHVARLIGQPFAAVAARDAVGMALEAAGAQAEDLEALKGLLRKNARVAQGEVHVRRLQLAGGTEAPPSAVAGFQLAMAPIRGELKSDSGARVQKTREEFGWLAVGSPKALGAREEILMLAAAQRLAELAEIARLEATIDMRGQFLSIASHELKTPLTSIYGMLQLQERMSRLKRDEPLNVQQERQQSYLKIVIRQVERLNELIDGLLDVSRIQNGRFMVEPCDTDVALLLKETMQNRLGLIAQEAGVSLHVDSPERLVAYVDPVRMEEVFTNLIMNAIRFSPEGGVVWIRLREEDGALRFTVRDQGPSLPVEDRERIFQPFERSQRTSRLGGLGLGLFISRQIAQLHGGEVRLLESVPGKGNVLEARMPMRVSAPDAKSKVISA